MDKWTVGEPVTWHHKPRGGYGYVLPTPGIVIRIGRSQVLIEVRKKTGEFVRRWVRPENLSKVPNV